MFTYHTSCTSSTPPLLLHLSPCIFIASFNEISCLIVFTVFRFALVLASYIFFSKFWSVIVSNAKADKRCIGSVFATVGFCKFKISKPCFETIFALCKWISAIATLLPTRFGKNPWHTVSMCKWLLQVAIGCECRVKISSVWVTAAICFFWGHVWRYRAD